MALGWFCFVSLSKPALMKSVYFSPKNLFSTSTDKTFRKKGRYTCTLYLPIDLKLNQEGVMDREWATCGFRGFVRFKWPPPSVWVLSAGNLQVFSWVSPKYLCDT